MSQYCLTIGSHPDISGWEISAVVPELETIAYSEHHILINASLDPSKYIEVLGGVVKIAKVIKIADITTLKGTLAKTLDTLPQNKIALSTNIPSFNLTGFIPQLKSEVSKKIHLRILKSTQESAGILSRYQEFQFIQIDQTMVLTQVSAVQDINRWNQIDYDKPVAYSKAGMLPPKVARMMLNIATTSTNQTIYDPFCGTGTILMQACELGHIAVGSDLSAQMVEATRQNLEWYQQTINPQATYQVFQHDATQIKHVSHRPDAVVFEGYLGPQQPRQNQLKNIQKGLYKLYKGFFKQVSTILKPDGVIVAALPYFSEFRSEQPVISLTTECEKFGLKLDHQPVIYGRPHAQVKRYITRFTLT